MKGLSRVRVLQALSLLLTVLLVPAAWAAGDADLLQQEGSGPGSTQLGAEELVSVTGAVDVRVNQISDDAEEVIATGTVRPKGTDLELGTDKDKDDNILPMAVGVRFTGLGIPRTAPITQAYIEFTASEPQAMATNVTIRGDDSDDAATFTKATGDISSRPKTTALVGWNGIPAWTGESDIHQTPDLKAIVQEIVNRPSWAPGNAMAFTITGSGRRTAWAFDGASTMAPRLVVNYSGQVTCVALTTTVNPLGAGRLEADPPPNCGPGKYYLGTSVQLQAIPTAANFAFANWSGGAAGTANPTTVTMNSAHAVTANFALKTCYSLTGIISPVEADPVGEIRPQPEPDCGDGTKPGKYIAGTSVAVDAVARGGWEFSGWSGALTGPVTPQTVLMNGNKTVTAAFTATCRRINMDIKPPEGGAVYYDPMPNCEGGSKWQPDTVVEIRGVPTPGWFFVKWTGDVPGGETFDNPITVVMDGTKAIDATFRFSSYGFWLPSVFNRKR